MWLNFVFFVQQLYPFGSANNDSFLFKDDSGFVAVLLSEDFVFYGRSSRRVYVRSIIMCTVNMIRALLINSRAEMDMMSYSYTPVQE